MGLKWHKTSLTALVFLWFLYFFLSCPCIKPVGHGSIYWSSSGPVLLFERLEYMEKS